MSERQKSLRALGVVAVVWLVGFVVYLLRVPLLAGVNWLAYMLLDRYWLITIGFMGSVAVYVLVRSKMD